MAEDWQLRFYDYLSFEKRYSKHTLISYQNDISQFFYFLLKEYNITAETQIKLVHIRSWLAEIKAQKPTTAAATINRKISSLQSYFKFLLRKQVVAENPAALLQAMRKPNRLPSFLREVEAEQLFETGVFEASFKGITERLICELFYSLGLRRGELVQLKEKNVEWSLRQIRVLGKGGKERLIPASPALLEAISAYLNEKKKILLCNHDFIFTLESGKPLYDAYVYRIVKKHLLPVTTQKKKSPHVLRHTFATHLLNNGANIQAIKDLLGHSSLAATQVYTHNSTSKLKEIHAKNHPRG